MTSPKKPRKGARGVPKVKSGCLTCKIRHKKCNETRPACFQCSSTGRICDFDSNHPRPYQELGAKFPLNLKPIQFSLARHMLDVTDFEASHFEYFRFVCAKEFALLFETTLWESLVVQIAHIEPSIYHAALAISALSRNHYSQPQFWYDPGYTSSVAEYSMVHYNLAIQCLNDRLDRSVESAQLAVLGSILFINIEILQEHQNLGELPNLISIHLDGGFAILQSLASSQNTSHLEAALYEMYNQAIQFQAIGKL